MKRQNVLTRQLTMFLLSALLIAFCSFTLIKAQAMNEEKTTKPPRVLVITGGHKFDKKSFYQMFEKLEKMDIRHVEIQKNCKFFNDISQWDYDVIVFYNFRNTLTEKGRKNLLQLCEQGVGLVVLHHAIAGFPEWQEWPRIVGATYFLQDTEIDGKLWKRSTWKHGVTFKIHVEPVKSAVTAGLSDFEILDETYKGYRMEPRNKILLTTEEPLSQEEIAWTRHYKKSPICYIQLGHDKHAYTNPNYQKLLKQSLMWASKTKTK